MKIMKTFCKNYGFTYLDDIMTTSHLRLYDVILTLIIMSCCHLRNMKQSV